MKHYHKSRKNTFTNSSAASIIGSGSSPLLFLAVSIILLTVSAFNNSLFESARTSIADMTAPLLTAVNTPFNKVSDFAGDVTGVAELRAENTKLIEENKRLNAWYQSALQLEAENKSLKEILNVKAPAGHDFISTRVYLDAGNSYVNSFLVAAGKDDGVKKGQVVLGEKGVIGRIIEAGDKTARILLINDINSRIPVIIEGSNQRSILTGTNKKHPKLKYLPIDTQVDINARIVTSGHGGAIPAGIPVGTINNTSNGIISVSPYSNLNSVKYVKIINIPEIPGLINNNKRKILP